MNNFLQYWQYWLVAFVLIILLGWWKRQRLIQILLFLEYHVLRWIDILSSITVAALIFCVEHDFETAKKESPEWEALWNILDSDKLVLLLIIAAFASVLTSIITSARQPKIKTLNETVLALEEEADKIGENIHNLFEGILLNLSKKLVFTQNGTERVTLYIHKNSHGCFVPCGRYSNNPLFQKKGRTRFDDDQGCISKGWQTGWHFDNKIPTGKPLAANYNNKNYGIPVDTASSLTMQSKLLAVKRIDGLEGRPVAVLVIESTNKAAFAENDLVAKLNGVSSEYGRMVQILERHIPSPQDAADKGL